MDILIVLILLAIAVAIYFVVAFFAGLPPFSSSENPPTSPGTSSTPPGTSPGTPESSPGTPHGTPANSPGTPPTPKPKPERPEAPLFDGEELRECINEVWAEIEDENKTGEEVEAILRNQCPGIETVRFLKPDSIVTLMIVPKRVSIITMDGTPKTEVVNVRHG